MSAPEFSRFVGSWMRVGTQDDTDGKAIVTVSTTTQPRDGDYIPFATTASFMRPAEAAELAAALRDAVAHVTPAVEAPVVHVALERKVEW